MKKAAFMSEVAIQIRSAVVANFFRKQRFLCRGHSSWWSSNQAQSRTRPRSCLLH